MKAVRLIMLVPFFFFLGCVPLQSTGDRDAIERAREERDRARARDLRIDRQGCCVESGHCGCPAGKDECNMPCAGCCNPMPCPPPPSAK